MPTVACFPLDVIPGVEIHDLSQGHLSFGSGSRINPIISPIFSQVSFGFRRDVKGVTRHSDGVVASRCSSEPSTGSAQTSTSTVGKGRAIGDRSLPFSPAAIYSSVCTVVAIPSFAFKIIYSLLR